jgi:hypothetical protein
MAAVVCGGGGGSGVQAAIRLGVRLFGFKYNIAVAQLRRMVAGQKKWPLPEPLGSALVSAARFQESTTRKVYVQALLIYSDLVIHGEVPD